MTTKNMPDFESLVRDKDLREALNAVNLDIIAGSLQKIANAFEHGGNTGYGVRVFAPEVEQMLQGLRSERNGL